ncbi:hypothetical protein BKA70DRAFT_1282624 [Coprinopsis sp. MPI-PUGE-AT-0042]|nr:hypothetical protein BKA70DRAFT_1282624 [Coprinopsis sp. MPI-PUGE-AT-0042]
MKTARRRAESGQQTAMLPFSVSEKLPGKISASIHHYMSKQVKSPNQLNLRKWIKETKNDPAAKNWVNKLKTHLLARHRGEPYEDEKKNYTPEELNQVIIVNDKVYRHKVLRVNYTTYNRRRAQDSINPRTTSDILMLSHDDDPKVHPYNYARVLGIFHAQVIFNTPGSDGQRQEVEFLFVRWFGIDKTHGAVGWKAKRLLRVGFIDERKDGFPAFGFVDPAQVIRALYLVTDFLGGRSTNGLGPSPLARREEDGDEDDNYFYADWCVAQPLQATPLTRMRPGLLTVISSCASEAEEWVTLPLERPQTSFSRTETAQMRNFIKSSRRKGSGKMSMKMSKTPKISRQRKIKSSGM